MQIANFLFYKLRKHRREKGREKENMRVREREREKHMNEARNYSQFSKSSKKAAFLNSIFNYSNEILLLNTKKKMWPQ